MGRSRRSCGLITSILANHISDLHSQVTDDRNPILPFLELKLLFKYS